MQALQHLCRQHTSGRQQSGVQASGALSSNQEAAGGGPLGRAGGACIGAAASVLIVPHSVTFTNPGNDKKSCGAAIQAPAAGEQQLDGH